MKKLCFLALMLSLLSSGVWAATLTNWVGPTGSFADNTKWSGSNGPSTWTSGSTSDEVKIPVEGAICNLDSDVSAYNCDHRISISSGPTLGATLNITSSAIAALGETRVGAQGATQAGSTGHVNQTGGTITFRDIIIGRGGSSGPSPATGTYTISGGSLTLTTGLSGRLYIGCGNSATVPNYTVGTFTVVGNDATIQCGTLYIGGNTSTYGTGTLAFQVDPDGVSPILVNTTYNIGVYTTDPALAVANLVLSATGSATPQADIVLVQVNGTTIPTTRFDALNGGPALEGTQVILGDNVYTLTYTYAANDAVQNDIALVHVANFADLAHNPIPANGATVTSLSSLSWTLPDPNLPGGVLTCDVYFGKGNDPNRQTMDKKTLGAGVSTIAINSTNFPHYVPLSDKTWYYWIVDVHDTTDPNIAYGVRWSVYTDINVAPYDVSAGDDQVVWLGMSGTPGREVVSLDGTATDDGLPNPPAALTYAWTLVSGPATAVINSPTAADTTVTTTERGTYEFQLAASDSVKTTTDTVQIIVGNNACDASHMMPLNPPYDAGDVNQDCIVDLQDFATLIARQWLCTQTDCGI